LKDDGREGRHKRRGNPNERIAISSKEGGYPKGGEG